jgi:hypothetical protein
MATEAPLPPQRGAVGLRCLAGGLASLLVVCAPAYAVEVEVRDHLVAIHAEGESLHTVLEAVAETCNIEIRSNTSMRQLVTVDTSPQPLPHLLHSLLRDHSYVLQYGGDGPGAQWLWILAPVGNGDASHAWSAGPREHSLDEFVLALADPDPEVRIEAVLALGDVGSTEVEPFLTQSLTDESDEVREAARAVLEDISASGPQNSHSTPTAGTSGSQ